MNQPLVVSRPKKKDIRMGRTQPIYLLPELCTVTGKNNFWERLALLSVYNLDHLLLFSLCILYGHFKYILDNKPVLIIILDYNRGKFSNLLEGKKTPQNVLVVCGALKILMHWISLCLVRCTVPEFQISIWFSWKFSIACKQQNGWLNGLELLLIWCKYNTGKISMPSK